MYVPRNSAWDSALGACDGARDPAEPPALLAALSPLPAQEVMLPATHITHTHVSHHVPLVLVI